MKRCFPLVIILMMIGTPLCFAQVSAGILAYPHLSKDQIVFTYADDLWLVSRKGGTAQKLSTPPGTELFARFSPDGRDIVFSGNYNGAVNLYRIPASGGVPFPLTNHGMADIMLNWYPDGNHILFASDRESGNNRFSQLYKIHKDGGLAQKLSIPYGEFGCISPMANALSLLSNPLSAARGNAIAAASLQISMSIIPRPLSRSISAIMRLLTNFPCGMAPPSTSSPTGAPKTGSTSGPMI